jgi:hypothetical protein
MSNKFMYKEEQSERDCKPEVVQKDTRANFLISTMSAAYATVAQNTKDFHFCYSAHFRALAITSAAFESTQSP